MNPYYLEISVLTIKCFFTVAMIMVGSTVFGHIVSASLADVQGLTRDTPVSLEAACIVGFAILTTGMYINGMKRDIKDLKRDVEKIKKHIFHSEVNKVEDDEDQL